MLSNWKFDHIGVAVPEIEGTAAVYKAAGYTQTEPVYDPIQNVDICFLTKEGMPKVELLAPPHTHTHTHTHTGAEGNSPVQQILDKIGVTPYHTCYEVENIEDAVAELRKMRYIVVRKPEPAIAFDNRRVCFLYNKQVGLIEIVER